MTDYPVTIMMDRYGGGYAGQALAGGGGWLAWPLGPDELPSWPEGADSEADAFWRWLAGTTGTLAVGRGETPDAAWADLTRKREKWEQAGGWAAVWGHVQEAERAAQ